MDPNRDYGYKIKRAGKTLTAGYTVGGIGGPVGPVRGGGNLKAARGHSSPGSVPASFKASTMPPPSTVRTGSHKLPAWMGKLAENPTAESAITAQQNAMLSSAMSVKSGQSAAASFHQLSPLFPAASKTSNSLALTDRSPRQGVPSGAAPAASLSGTSRLVPSGQPSPQVDPGVAAQPLQKDATLTSVAPASNSQSASNVGVSPLGNTSAFMAFVNQNTFNKKAYGQPAPRPAAPAATPNEQPDIKKTDASTEIRKIPVSEILLALPEDTTAFTDGGPSPASLGSGFTASVSAVSTSGQSPSLTALAPISESVGLGISMNGFGEPLSDIAPPQPADHASRSTHTDESLKDMAIPGSTSQNAPTESLKPAMFIEIDGRNYVLADAIPAHVLPALESSTDAPHPTAEKKSLLLDNGYTVGASLLDVDINEEPGSKGIMSKSQFAKKPKPSVKDSRWAKGASPPFKQPVLGLKAGEESKNPFENYSLPASGPTSIPKAGANLTSFGQTSTGPGQSSHQFLFKANDLPKQALQAGGKAGSSPLQPLSSNTITSSPKEKSIFGDAHVFPGASKVPAQSKKNPFPKPFASTTKSPSLLQQSFGAPSKFQPATQTSKFVNFPNKASLPISVTRTNAGPGLQWLLADLDKLGLRGGDGDGGAQHGTSTGEPETPAKPKPLFQLSGKEDKPESDSDEEL